MNRSSLEQPIEEIPMEMESKISIAWRHLRYETSSFLNREKVPILRRLTGCLEYHSLNGFMGPSGCGKTTLIRCLTGDYISGLTSETEIYLNPKEKHRPVIGLIERPVHEMIVGQMTVGEALRYAFLFKNDWSMRDRMKKHIDSIIDELMLDPKILKRRFDLCSGGEQKRIAIAQELMSLHHQPSLLFVDEPTTGLDSNSALVVMKCLKRLVNHHEMSIAISIHTPNSEIVDLFDKLYVLAKGGVCIYSGKPSLLRINLKTQLGLESVCDDHDVNEKEKQPIEEYLKIACSGIDDPKVRILADATVLTEQQQLKPHLSRLDYLEHGTPEHFKPFHLKDLIVEFIRLFNIMFLINYKSVLAVLITFTYHFVLISTVFNGPEIVRTNACCELETEQHLHNQSGTNQFNNISADIISKQSNDFGDCYDNLQNSAHHDSFIMHQSMTTLFISSVAMGMACFLFVPIVKVFHNEHRNCWYSITTFYCSLTLIQLIESVLYVLTSTSLIYFTMDFLYLDQYRMNWIRFGHFLFFYWIEFLFMQSFGHFLLILAGHRIQIFMVLVQVFITVLFVFNGHFIILEQLDNPWAITISNLMATRYINNGVLYSFYGLDRCDDITREYSVMLAKYSVDTENLFRNLKPVLINMFILRFLTLVFMWLRFSYRGKSIRMNQSTKDISIDYEKDVRFSNDIATVSKVARRKKSVKEIEFEQFCRGKIHIAWRQLSLFGSRMLCESPSIEKFTNPKLILRNLNGQFRFGTLNAIMGTSGSGKTSLLKVLNGRWKTRLSDESKIYITKYTPTKICYISQEIADHLLPGLTARQSLIYAAKLKNIIEKENHEIDYEEIALELFDDLDIAHTASTLVDYCSDGERKRIALALELTSLTMPNLICIDEPTSGLDSNSAEVEIQCLRKLVRRHLITIMISIHQPNTEILTMFDQIYCLARGGVCLFSGSPAKIAENLFKIPDINLPEPCGCTVTTEELMKYSCLSHDNLLVQKLRVLSDNEIIVEGEESLRKDLVLLPDGIQRNRPRFTMNSFRFLFYRYWIYQKNYLWLETISYMALYLFHAFMLRFLFNPSIVQTSGCVNLEDDFKALASDRLQEQIDLVNNSCFTILINVFFLLIFLVQSGFALTKEFVYFFNEHRNGWYSTMSFYLMKSGCEIFSLIPMILLYCYIVDVFESIHFGFYWWLFLLTLLGTLVIQGQSHFFAMVIGPNFLVLIVVTFANFFTWFVLSNCFNPINEMHYGYQFLSQFSVLRFINEALFELQYGFDRCDSNEISAVLYKMMLPRDSEGQYFYHCLRMLIFQIFFYRILALGTLLFKSNPRQNRRSRGIRIRNNFIEQQQQSNQYETVLPGLSTCQHQFCIKRIEI
ncbi:ABC transporter G family member 40 [Sarcoptes scabiei]|uniref:ABC transporter G family member 40 n=1 Tax=Sarcoptes scabiei TaxID=52283 RepID=A0A834R8H9_SARSC|nr:ABC transporter G family member 40 [Sarcoptes scabiei]